MRKSKFNLEIDVTSPCQIQDFAWPGVESRESTSDFQSRESGVGSRLEISKVESRESGVELRFLKSRVGSRESN